MNKVSGTALVAVGLLAGVGLTAIGSRVSQIAPQSGQVAPQSVASPVASPVAVQQAQPQSSGLLETKNLAFRDIKIARYTGDVPDDSDVAGELYQVTATITNRSNETMSPSGLGGVSYKLKDSEDRKYQAADFLIGLGDDGLKSTDGILPGQTREGIIVGVFDVLPGATGLELGVNDGWFSDTKYVGPARTQQAAAQPPAQPSASPVLVSSPTSPAPDPIAPFAATPDFDSMTPCDQLDAVAKSGKSVADFVKADWAKYGGVGSVCAWHQPQIETARRVLFPPAPAPVRTVRRSTSGGSSGGSGQTVIVREAPQTFNNCNGIRERGESYSGVCDAAQTLNDAGLGNARTRWIDQRPPREDLVWRPGVEGHRGYGSGEAQDNE